MNIELKKYRLLPALFLNLLLILSSCEKNSIKDQPIDPGDPVNIPVEIYKKEVIDSANRFAFDLFKPILAEAGPSVE